MDVMHFIWSDYKRLGYVTSLIEDTPQMGAFTGTGRDVTSLIEYTPQMESFKGTRIKV